MRHSLLYCLSLHTGCIQNNYVNIVQHSLVRREKRKLMDITFDNIYFNGYRHEKKNKNNNKYKYVFIHQVRTTEWRA